MDTLNVLTAPINAPLLIEASAGTGKTYSLMHLILRLIVEKQMEVERILIVTFTKNATSELKLRLYEKLQEVRNLFANLDEIEERLSSLGDRTLAKQAEKWIEGKTSSEMEELRAVIENALLHMEDASIFTIHSFCQRMLKKFAFSSRNDFDLENADTSALEQKAIDTIVRREAKKITDDNDRLAFLESKNFQEIFKRAKALSRRIPIEKQVVLMFGDELSPALREAYSNFIVEAPEELRRLKEDMRLQDFDDLLLQMEENLKESSFIKHVSDAYDAVLIDEFQDTDPIQFSIFRTIFLDHPKPGRPVIFVGDPKQSIYSFRSAELETYFQARKLIPQAAELDTNYRSTPALISAANTFFADKASGKSFLNPNLSYSEIKSTPSRLPLFKKLEDGTYQPLPPLEIWMEKTDENSAATIRYPFKDELIAEDIVNLLKSNVYIGNELRPIRPSDITILVKNWKDADGLKIEMNKRHIRYLSEEQNNVLETEEASEIAQILRAMEDPKSFANMNRARSTRIIGEDLKSILQNEAALLKAREVLSQAAEDFTKLGILAAFREIFIKFGTDTRILKQLGGERRLTNYQHVLELLHAQNRKVKTISSLIRWLESSHATDEDKYLRRESDADLVRIESIHKSKGLEYPVVYILNPSNQPGAIQSETVERLKGNGDKTQYLIRIGKEFDSSKENPATVTKAEQEREEAIRKFYVAFTRASARLVLPFFFNKNKKGKIPQTGHFSINGQNLKSPVFQVLSGQITPNATDIDKILYEDLPETLTKLDTKIIEGAKGTELEGKIHFETTPFPAAEFRFFSVREKVPVTQLLPPEGSTPSLKAANPNRRNSPWIRTSFTGLTKNIEGTEEGQAFDEDTSDEPETDFRALVPLSFLEDEKIQDFRGDVSAVRYGNFLHELLEGLSFNLAQEPENNKTKILQTVKDKLTSLGIQRSGEKNFNEHAEYIANMLINTLRTKAFKAMPNFMLCDLDEESKVPEMDFLISVSSPKTGRKKLTAKDLGEMLEILDPRYTGLTFSEKEMTGFLTGSIDLAFKANNKFWIIDWKSNYLSEYLSEYSGSYLNEAMNKKHYKLQMLLYLVALKRYLETRLKVPNGYDLIGGAAYFFLRGIRENQPGNGIYFERPHDAVINCIDDAFKNGYSKERVLQYKDQIGK